MKKIAIYGAGDFGQMIYENLKGSHEVKVIAFIDNYVKDGERKLPVWSMADLKARIQNIDVIWTAVINEGVLEEIVLSLYEAGVKNVGIPRPDSYDKLKSGGDINDEDILYLDLLQKAFMGRLEFHVCDVCNLNCKGCSHFAPIFTGGFVLPQNFRKQIERAAEKFHISCLRLMGGEPFLHKQLGEFVKIARNLLPDTRLEIVTNGLLLMGIKGKIWDVIKENKATLCISLYPPVFRIKDKLKDYLEGKEVSYRFVRGLEQKNQEGIIEEFHKGFTNKRTHNATVSGKNCMGSICRYLRDGKISRCALPLLSPYINMYYGEKYILEDVDYISLEDNSLSPWDMVRRLHEATPFCGYCVEGRTQRFSWQAGAEPALSDNIVIEDE